MTYQVKYEEYRRYFLTFDSEDDFKGWEDDGSSISDLLPSQINLSKCDIDVTEVEVTK
jgi:hypothetical protein|tara:strand:- start:1129 stop:1302 length:174 start_codon:yes stop_codon:yes gene_type:complete